MKPHIHPPYQRIAFRDHNTGSVFVTRSTLQPTATIEIDGEVLPVHHVEISRASHPFLTGAARTVDTEGRIARFNRRYGSDR